MATYPKPTENFNPGEDPDLGYIRIIDGHRPWSGGDDGANKHPGGEFISTEIETEGLPVDTQTDAS